MSLIKLFSWLLEWLDTTQMVMVIQNKQISIIIITPNNICYYNFAYYHFLGVSLIRPYSWLLEGLDTTQMVMVVRKQ